MRGWRAGALACTLCAAIAPASAATLSLPADAGAPPGAAARVPVLIDDASGLLGTYIEIAYDPTVAVATSISQAPLSAPQTLTYNLSPPGLVRISLFGSDPLAGWGALVEIAFDSVGPLNSRTRLDLVRADLNEGEIASVLADGSYCVQALVSEVRNLRLSGPGFGTILEWDTDPAAAGYNIYRGADPRLTDLACFRSALTEPFSADPDLPPAGGLLVYLATAVNCRGEATLGSTSEGVERQNRFPCP